MSMTHQEFIRRRNRLGLTQAQLAKQLGVTPLAVSFWERGTRRISGPVAKLLTLLCQLQRVKRARRKR